MMDIQDASDYFILMTSDAGASLNLLKLQKLVYYAEAWHWAIHSGPLTGSDFQAWVHGPVNRELYDRFKEQKSLYSPVGRSDIRAEFNPDAIHPDARYHLDDILEAYGKFTGSQLEELTHNEDPWVLARAEYRPTERCEAVIKPEHMKAYYGARL
jgi:uncharacterized phage-associated protein